MRQHIRFADFWYAANGQFTDLQEHCQQIAADAGLRMTADQAWAWLAQGGFTNDVLGQAGIGGSAACSRRQARHAVDDRGAESLDVNDFNVFSR